MNIVNHRNALKRETLTCDVCGERLRIEGELPGVTYCQVFIIVNQVKLLIMSLSVLRPQSQCMGLRAQMVGDPFWRGRIFLFGEEITHQCRC